jgi:hypothetical protein
MLRPDKRHPAAPELLGSMAASGVEHFGLKAENPEDTPSFGFNQSFPARWLIRPFGPPPHRAATKYITTPTFRNSAAYASDAANLRFKQNLDKLYRLGPRAIAAIFRYLGATSFHMTEIGHRFVGGRHD